MDAKEAGREREGALRVFLIFLRLGLTSFGGPVAHLGYFREEFVTRRRWLSERSYADLVALCQFLPGPASSQVGIALGLSERGYIGALAAWTGFTLPSAIALVAFATAITSETHQVHPGVVHGLKIVAVAVVAQAVLGMAKSLCAGPKLLAFMGVAACLALYLPTALSQIFIVTVAGTAGLLLFKPVADSEHEPLSIGIGRTGGALFLSAFLGLLVGLPLLRSLTPNQTAETVDSFYRAGSLVFGGGHVVLPLLEASVLPQNLVDKDVFLAGYGAAQAVPGPLFTFAAFLGASMKSGPSGWSGALICLLAVFTPSFLLVLGALPFWEGLRSSLKTRAALMGINAAVVGILLAALYHPVSTSAISLPRDFVLAVASFTALVYWKIPSWVVVIGCGVAGWLMAGTS